MSALLKHIAKGVSFFAHTEHCAKMIALVHEDPARDLIEQDPDYIRYYNEWFHTLNNTSWTMSQLRSSLERLSGAVLNGLLRHSNQTLPMDKGRMVAGTVKLRDVTVFFIQTYDLKDHPGAPEYFSVPYYGFMCALSQRYNRYDPHTATIWGMRDPDDVVFATEDLDKQKPTLNQ